MKVLISNDDGFDAPGIVALAEAIKIIGWEAVIIAPLKQSSGAGRSRVSDKSIAWGRASTICGFPRFWVDSSPAACVVFGLTSGLFDKFNLCIGGINAGENLGAGLTISGTFGIALESASFNVRGIAISRQYESLITPSELWDWSWLPPIVAKLIVQVTVTNQDWIMANINIPQEVNNESKICLTEISKSSYFFDKYNITTGCIESGIGYHKDQLRPNDDINVFGEQNNISISLLKGKIV